MVCIGILVCLASIIPAFGVAPIPYKKFEYKYSFKGPYLAQKDKKIPFWDYSGNAIASEESLRITPSLRSQKGQSWAKNPINFEWWEVELVFRVNGRGRIGADGLAFWYIVTPAKEGPVFGSADMWDGLAVFFDSFDNDNKRNNPYIMAMVNDGTKNYDHENDGLSQQLGGCLRDFRNKPYPVKAKIEYYQNVLTVLVHNGMTNNDKDFEICLRAENVHLPSTGYFGITGATGGLADDQDVLRFLVSSLRSPEEMANIQMSIDEEERFQEEFKQYKEKTDQARKDFESQHPSIKKKEDEYETEETRELRQIFQGQGKIRELVYQLNIKMDEIIGRQERALGMIAAVQSGSQALSQGQVPPPSAVPPGTATSGGMQRHEIDSLLASQRDISQLGREIKNFVTEIHSKSNQLINTVQKPQGSVQPAGYDFHVTLNEMKESLNIVKRDLGIASQKIGVSQSNQKECPQSGCISTTVFAACIVVQVVLLLGYFYYRDNKEAQAKKFY